MSIPPQAHAPPSTRRKLTAASFLRKSHGPANVPLARPLGRPFRIHPRIKNEQPLRGHSNGVPAKPSGFVGKGAAAE